MKKTLQLTAATALLVLTALSSGANTITFNTPSGATGTDGPLNAGVVITSVNGGVTVTLTDFLANPTSAGQLVSGLIFNITDATGVGSVAGSGILGTITQGNPATILGSSTLSHWSASLSGSTVTLTTLSGGKPSQLIIGPTDGSGNYSAANASIANFNSAVLGTATFTLSLSGVNANSIISGVEILFGTGPDTVVSVPDGASTLALLGFALSGIGLMGRKSARVSR